MKKIVINLATILLFLICLLFAKPSFAQEAIIEVIKYNDSIFENYTVNSPQEAKNSIDENYVTWIDVRNSSQKNIMSEFVSIFNLPEKVSTETIDLEAIPKIDELEDDLFLIVKTVESENIINQIHLEHIGIIWSNNYVITFNESNNDNFAYVKELIKKETSRNLWSNYQLETGYLIYNLMDTVVDNYFSALDVITRQLDQIEKEIFTSQEADILKEIYNIKREITKGKRAIWPMRNTIGYLVNYDYPQISSDLKQDFRGIYDNLNTLVEISEILSSNNTEIVNFYISVRSDHTNDILRFLTIISTILFVLSFIAAVYGLNFSQFHPTEKRKRGHSLVIVAMIIMALALIAFFWVINWI